MSEPLAITCIGFKADVIWGGSGEMEYIYVSLSDATSEYYMTKTDLQSWLSDDCKYSYILACEMWTEPTEIEWVFDLEESK